MNMVRVNGLAAYAFLIAVLIIGGCDGRKVNEMGTGKHANIQLSETAMKALGSKRILFGHQSVGSNILSGVEELKSGGTNIFLNVFKADAAGSANKAGLHHFSVGKNGDPFAKIDDFEKRIRGGLGSNVDVAFFKFCYVDMEASTEITKIFIHYQKVMEGLKKDYPSVRFAHVTVPLVTVQTGPKAWVKKIIGKPLHGVEDNYKRNEFNKLLLAAYGEKDPIFDLAKVESSYPDGTRARGMSGGKEIFVMAPEYTTDGGHLNEIGRQEAAAEFLQFLASACK
jgi:hypothetical protein